MRRHPFTLRATLYAFWFQDVGGDWLLRVEGSKHAIERERRAVASYTMTPVFEYDRRGLR